MTPPKEDVVKTNPDPTEAVKEALTLAIKNLDDKFEARFAAIGHATILARNELKDQLIALNETIKGKFDANKDLVDQLAKANAVALSAALQTQKESAAKSEVAMADLLKQLQLNYETANKTIIETLNRVTSRLDTGEGRGFAVVESKQDRSTDKGQSIAIGSGLIALAALAYAILHGR